MSAFRLLFVTHTYPRFSEDAAGSFLHRLATALRAGGCEIRVLAPSGEGLPPASEIDHIPVRRFRYAPKGMESLANGGSLTEQVLGSLKGKGALAGLLAAGSVALSRAVDDFKPDIVHAHWWFPAGLIALAGAGAAPLVTTLHGSDLRLARRVKLVHPVVRRVFERSDAVTAVSQWLAGEARAIAPGLSVSVVPSPADVGLFRGARHDRIAGRFIFVGRLAERDGVGDLLEALAWTDRSATLDIVGAGPDEARLRARAGELGIAGRVQWLGKAARKELPALYGRSRALIAWGTGPGQGSAAVEAQLSRTPVIACRAGVLPEIVSAEWGGALVTRGHSRDLAEAMRAVLAAPDTAEGHGSSARARMIDRFAPSSVAASYQALYRGVLRNAG